MPAQPGNLRLSLHREHGKIRLRFFEHPREGWPRHQAIEIGPRAPVLGAERRNGVCIEKRRGCRAISQGKGVAHRPAVRFHPRFDHRVGAAELSHGLLYAERISTARGAQPIAHDFLHELLNVQIVEAVPHPCLPGEITISRYKRRRRGPVSVEIFDNDRRFRDGAVACLVTQHREFCQRPQRPERRARFLVA